MVNKSLDYIKNYYLIVWSVEKIQNVKIKSCKDQKLKNNAFIKICSV